MFLFMRSRIFWSLGLFLGLAGALQAESKPHEAFVVRPSSQTVKRRESALALGQAKDASQAGPGLLQALNDKDSMTRSLAVQGLGNLKYASARPRLAEILATDPSEDVREAAAVSLRQIGDPKAVDDLAKAINDKSVNVRVTVLTGIGYYRDAKARPQVEAACKDKSVEVRRTAVYVLARLEDPKAVAVVQELAKDPDASVRAAAAQTLAALHATDSKSILAGLLKDPDHAVQASAARSLLMLRDASGLETANSLVLDPNIAVRLLAIDALGWSPDPTAGTRLTSLLTEAPADSRIAVQEALARHQQLRKRP